MPNAEVIRSRLPEAPFPPENTDILNSPEIILPHTAFLFPGQGVQRVGMGKELYQNSEAAREVFDMADDVLGFKVSQLCFDGPLDTLNDTATIQPAIVATSLAYAAALQERLQLKQNSDALYLPRVVAGHSLGEYAALVTAGVISPKDAIGISMKRGELMKQASGEGSNTEYRKQGMGVITGWNEQKVKDLLSCGFEDSVFLANVNTETQIIISGYADEIDIVLEEAKNMSARVGRIAVPVAAHSPLMESQVKDFQEYLSEIQFHEPRTDLIMNSSNQLSSDPESIRNSLLYQLTHGVHWQTMMQSLNQLGIQRYIEVGPGNVLSGLIKRGNPDLAKENIMHVEDFLEDPHTA